MARDPFFDSELAYLLSLTERDARKQADAGFTHCPIECKNRTLQPMECGNSKAYSSRADQSGRLRRPSPLRHGPYRGGARGRFDPLYAVRRRCGHHRHPMSEGAVASR